MVQILFLKINLLYVDDLQEEKSEVRFMIGPKLFSQGSLTINIFIKYLPLLHSHGLFLSHNAAYNMVKIEEILVFPLLG